MPQALHPRVRRLASKSALGVVRGWVQPYGKLRILDMGSLVEGPVAVWETSCSGEAREEAGCPFP